MIIVSFRGDFDCYRAQLNSINTEMNLYFMSLHDYKVEQVVKSFFV